MKRAPRMVLRPIAAYFAAPAPDLPGTASPGVGNPDTVPVVSTSVGSSSTS